MVDLSEIEKELGSKIRLARSSRKRSQEELANHLGLKRTSVTNIELGKQKVSVGMLFQISEFLNCKPCDLLPNYEIGSSDATKLEEFVSSLDEIAREGVLGLIEKHGGQYDKVAKEIHPRRG